MRNVILFPIFFFIAGAGLGYSPSAHAFPENVRHGYVNCSSCHINPNGGGQLNDYGRQLSAAIQSHGRFFFESANAETDAAAAASAAKPAKASGGVAELGDAGPEVEFLYGHVPHPEWLKLGGDARFLQLFEETRTVSQARFITMQLDLEGAVTVGKLTMDATVGRDDPAFYGTRDPGFWDYLVSRRHYALLQLTDEFYVMGGRYWKPYGINDARHISVTKRGLGTRAGTGWDFGTESYNTQVGFQNERFSVTGFWDFGRFGDAGKAIEHGGGLTASIALHDTYKIGASYFNGATDSLRRNVFGPWAILGFTEHFYLRTEQDFVSSHDRPSQASALGYFQDTRLGYELTQGFHVYGEQQYAVRDFSASDSRQQIYGVGVLYYPRAHWELEANYRKIRVEAVHQGFTDSLYLLGHYYL
jgi:hypothetical protein